MMLLLYNGIFLVLISLTIAVQLDGGCSDNGQCEGNTLLCLEQKCQCKTPSYRPCRSSCEIYRNFAYEGEDCEVQENCVNNTICLARKCQCIADYTAKNGLCLKRLTATCTNNSQCWSQYCLNSQCTCAAGYEPHSDLIGCQRKLVNIYENWADANRANEFCSDDTSCRDILAQCVTAPGQPTNRFCKCPDGYEVINENKQCQAITSTLLSPLNSSVMDYGRCGDCEDRNAVCMKAGEEVTCWCRAGYAKQANTCRSYMKSLIIFPNSNDVDLHNFTNGCLGKLDEKLCVCAPGYEYISKDRPCVKIQRDWINDVYEYGLCTRITSTDLAIAENGLCPEPLKCEGRKDKYICSCGENKFRDLDDPSQCVKYIDSKVNNSSNDKCPTKYGVLNPISGICECFAGYKPTVNKRQCEINLSSTVSPRPSNSNQTNDKTCVDLFGKKAFLYVVGECRCSGDDSFPNSGQTSCYAPVNKALVPPMENCPLNSTLRGDRCQCNDGFRSSNDSRYCVHLKVELVEYRGPPTNTNGQLTTEDCRTFFQGPVEAYANNICQCRDVAHMNDDANGCWYRVGAALPRPEEISFCTPNSRPLSTSVCQCKDGFIATGYKCMPIANQVYLDNDSTATITNGINDNACANVFGTGSMKSRNGNYCICRADAYPVNNRTYCHFLINAVTADIKDAETCPANTYINGSNPTACVCKAGYHVSSNNQRCETTDIVLSGAIDAAIPYITNCVNVNNQTCSVKYGEHAICRDEKCYCHRRLSFINADNKCESFSNFIFPGVHERTVYSCSSETDCGDKDNVICDYLTATSEYKVCKCKEGSLFDPKLQTCGEPRCRGGCDARLNFECRGYECVCKNGYYPNGGVCSAISSKLQLNQPCDPKVYWDIEYTATTNDSLQCDLSCERARCKPGHRPEEQRCVPYQLNDDKCFFNENICRELDENSICSRDENRCLCKPSYYSYEDSCARAVGSPCTRDEQCGAAMVCEGQRCDCNDQQHIEQISDIYNRPMRGCVPNGNNQMRFNLILVLFFVLIQVFLT